MSPSHSPNKKPTALRFLFLDEANRLCTQSMTVLIELCASLGLQLLIAAPEVQNAVGNLTYRLTRDRSRGRDEVRFFGRKVVEQSLAS